MPCSLLCETNIMFTPKVSLCCKETRTFIIKFLVSRSFCYLLHILHQVCDYYYFFKHFFKTSMSHAFLRFTFCLFYWIQLVKNNILKLSCSNSHLQISLENPHAKIQSGLNYLFRLLISLNECVHNICEFIINNYIVCD